MTGGDLTPQARCLELGPQALSDVEIVATVLADSRPKDDALAQAQELLDETPRGLRGLLSFEGLPGELEQLGSFRTAALLAAIELARRLAKVAIPERPLRDQDAIAAYINTRYGTIDQEVFGVLYLSLDFRWLDDREIFRGAMTRVTVEPRPILRHGLRLGATHFVLFHTHPSGSAKPSDEDREVTLRMLACGELIGIALADHLVVDSTGRWESAKPLPI